jgi:hypothetical protein
MPQQHNKFQIQRMFRCIYYFICICHMRLEFLFRDSSVMKTEIIRQKFQI